MKHYLSQLLRCVLMSTLFFQTVSTPYVFAQESAAPTDISLSEDTQKYADEFKASLENLGKEVRNPGKYGENPHNILGLLSQRLVTGSAALDREVIYLKAERDELRNQKDGLKRIAEIETRLGEIEAILEHDSVRQLELEKGTLEAEQAKLSKEVLKIETNIEEIKSAMTDDLRKEVEVIEAEKKEGRADSSRSVDEVLRATAEEAYGPIEELKQKFEKADDRLYQLEGRLKQILGEAGKAEGLLAKAIQAEAVATNSRVRVGKVQARITPDGVVEIFQGTRVLYVIEVKAEAILKEGDLIYILEKDGFNSELKQQRVLFIDLDYFQTAIGRAALPIFKLMIKMETAAKSFSWKKDELVLAPEARGEPVKPGKMNQATINVFRKMQLQFYCLLVNVLDPKTYEANVDLINEFAEYFDKAARGAAIDVANNEKMQATPDADVLKAFEAEMHERLKFIKQAAEVDGMGPAESQELVKLKGQIEDEIKKEIKERQSRVDQLEMIRSNMKAEVAADQKRIEAELEAEREKLIELRKELKVAKEGQAALEAEIIKFEQELKELGERNSHRANRLAVEIESATTELKAVKKYHAKLVRDISDTKKTIQILEVADPKAKNDPARQARLEKLQEAIELDKKTKPTHLENAERDARIAELEKKAQVRKELGKVIANEELRAELTKKNEKLNAKLTETNEKLSEAKSAKSYLETEIKEIAEKLEAYKGQPSPEANKMAVDLSYLEKDLKAVTGHIAELEKEATKIKGEIKPIVAAEAPASVSLIKEVAAEANKVGETELAKKAALEKFGREYMLMNKLKKQAIGSRDARLASQGFLARARMLGSRLTLHRPMGAVYIQQAAAMAWASLTKSGKRITKAKVGLFSITQHPFFRLGVGGVALTGLMAAGAHVYPESVGRFFYGGLEMGNHFFGELMQKVFNVGEVFTYASDKTTLPLRDTGVLKEAYGVGGKTRQLLIGLVPLVSAAGIIFASMHSLSNMIAILKEHANLTPEEVEAIRNKATTDNYGKKAGRLSWWATFLDERSKRDKALFIEGRAGTIGVGDAEVEKTKAEGFTAELDALAEVEANRLKETFIFRQVARVHRTAEWFRVRVNRFYEGSWVQRLAGQVGQTSFISKFLGPSDFGKFRAALYNFCFGMNSLVRTGKVFTYSWWVEWYTFRNNVAHNLNPFKILNFKFSPHKFFYLYLFPRFLRRTFSREGDGPLRQSGPFTVPTVLNGGRDNAYVAWRNRVKSLAAPLEYVSRAVPDWVPFIERFRAQQKVYAEELSMLHAWEKAFMEVESKFQNIVYKKAMSALMAYKPEATFTILEAGGIGSVTEKFLKNREVGTFFRLYYEILMDACAKRFLEKFSEDIKIEVPKKGMVAKGLEAVGLRDPMVTEAKLLKQATVSAFEKLAIKEEVAAEIVAEVLGKVDVFEQAKKITEKPVSIKRWHANLVHDIISELDPKNTPTLERTWSVLRGLRDPARIARAINHMIAANVVDKPLELATLIITIAAITDGAFAALQPDWFGPNSIAGLSRIQFYEGWLMGVITGMFADVGMKLMTDEQVSEAEFAEIPRGRDARMHRLRYFFKKFTDPVNNSLWSAHKHLSKIIWINMPSATVYLFLFYMVFIGRFDVDLYLSGYLTWYLTAYHSMGQKIQMAYEKSLMHKLGKVDKRVLRHPKVVEAFTTVSTIDKVQFQFLYKLFYENPIGQFLKNFFNMKVEGFGPRAFWRALTGTTPTMMIYSFLEGIKSRFGWLPGVSPTVHFCEWIIGFHGNGYLTK